MVPFLDYAIGPARPSSGLFCPTTELPHLHPQMHFSGFRPLELSETRHPLFRRAGEPMRFGGQAQALRPPVVHSNLEFKRLLLVSPTDFQILHFGLFFNLPSSAVRSPSHTATV